MSVEPSKLSAGHIVWAILRDHHGYRKRRPAIILTPDTDISEDQPLVLMAVTTTYPDPPPDNHIELPWNPDRRRVATGLARRSAAIIDWLDTAYVDEVEQIIGSVSASLMRQIMNRLRKASEDEGESGGLGD